jgi:hypothetical protein
MRFAFELPNPNGAAILADALLKGNAIKITTSKNFINFILIFILYTVLKPQKFISFSLNSWKCSPTLPSKLIL